MKTLIDEGVIRLGDIWKFYYVYGKGLNRIVIEKETRVCIGPLGPHLGCFLTAIDQ